MSDLLLLIDFYFLHPYFNQQLPQLGKMTKLPSSPTTIEQIHKKILYTFYKICSKNPISFEKS